MIRESVNGDISDEELEKLLKPFSDNYNEYLESYITPEVIEYYIANSYYRHSMYKGSFLQHHNSAKDIVNYFVEDSEKVKAEIYKLLRVKYALLINNKKPLEIVRTITIT